MIGLIECGKVKAKSADEVNNSRLGLGFEKLDRDVFNPEKAYDKVAKLGVKWIRIQSGWAKTETQKGVYDFEWLDMVIDNLLSRRLKPWICLCYGNGLYSQDAAKIFGAVGVPPIFTDEQKNAWTAYVNAIVKHYKDKVEYFEIWNEPDGIWCWKHGVSAEEYGDFAVKTAKTIKEANENAKVVGFAQCLRDLHYAKTALSRGMYKYIDAISFHEYTADEFQVFDRVKSLRALCKTYNDKIEIIQGESGSQSKYGGAGALAGGSWTERKQAKQLLRHTIADLICDVKFSSYFSCMDMIEALNGTVDNKSSYLDYAYFGVLGADFDDNGVSIGTYSEKPSYYALQNTASLFCEDFTSYDLPVMFTPEHSDLLFHSDCTDKSIVSGGFEKNGNFAFAYWNSLDLMTTDFESTITLQIAAPSEKHSDDLLQQLRLVDLYDGKKYMFDESIVEKTDGCVTLKHIPIKDYPLIITVGEF